ncbi:MAG TPA: hypothetical protein VK196_15100 [Magnetospirillum sp.]|nr:hypothetical protein [Magnetospirillum sp.]
MPFVIRDESGQVIALAEVPLDEDGEELPPDDPEVLAFLARTCDHQLDSDEEAFIRSDLQFIRVLEDLIEVLLRKGVITLSDLPAAAQDKLMGRRALRALLAGVAGYVGDSGD